MGVEGYVCVYSMVFFRIMILYKRKLGESGRGRRWIGEVGVGLLGRGY